MAASLELALKVPSHHKVKSNDLSPGMRELDPEGGLTKEEMQISSHNKEADLETLK